MYLRGPRFDAGWRFLLGGFLLGCVAAGGAGWLSVIPAVLILLALVGAAFQDEDDLQRRIVTSVHETTLTLSSAASVRPGDTIRVERAR